MRPKLTSDCSVPDCKRPYNALGYCRLHYGRLKDHGDPHWIKPTALDRFLRLIVFDGPTPIHCPNLGPCWEWKGPRGRDGYGQLQVGQRPVRVHRLSYEWFIGPIPEGLHVCHHCDFPACANPDHLFAGTDKDNNLDMVRKGRQRHPALEQNGRAKLSAADVYELRAAYLQGCRQVDLANRYGVCQSQVSHIILRKQWALLP